MKINFKEAKVESLKFYKGIDPTEKKFELSYSVFYSKENDCHFSVRFDLVLLSPSGYKIELSYLGFFEADAPIDEEFKKSKFVSVNAPAICYPYLRSFITTYTANAGYESVVLPTINFLALEKNKGLTVSGG